MNVRVNNNSMCTKLPSGRKVWRTSLGILHREDGPAIEGLDGVAYWYLNGIHYETPIKMPISLFLLYCQWMRNKK